MSEMNELVTCPICGGCAEKWMASDHNAQMERIAKHMKALEAENARLKSEIVSKDKKVTDYEKELRQLHKYDKTCSTCRYLDENQNCVLGIRCVNYALWQGRIL